MEKNIKLGTGPKTADDFRAALKKGGFKVGDWSDEILGYKTFFTSVSVSGKEVELVIKSVAELGFASGAPRASIYRKATEGFGLELCPAEVGPQLRLQYPDQPEGEWLIIAMDPIVDFEGDSWLFRVGHDHDGLWLLIDSGHSNYFWPAGTLFVFCLKK